MKLSLPTSLELFNDGIISAYNPSTEDSDAAHCGHGTGLRASTTPDCTSRALSGSCTTHGERAGDWRAGLCITATGWELAWLNDSHAVSPLRQWKRGAKGNQRGDVEGVFLSMFYIYAVVDHFRLFAASGIAWRNTPRYSSKYLRVSTRKMPFMQIKRSRWPARA